MSDRTPSHLNSSVFDFSQLKRSAEPAGQANTAAAQSVQSVTESGQLVVASLVLEATMQNLPEILKLSNQIPVLVDVFTARAETSATLSAKLVAEVERRDGTVLLLRLDGDANERLLGAFQVEHLPSVTALLKGQSIPLFAGDQPAEAISNIVDRMLAVAADNGVVGTAKVDPDAQLAVPEEPELPPKHQAAFELIDEGDYDGAIKQYQNILAESPADQLAVSGLAQVQLLKRVDGLDFAAIAGKPAVTADEATVKADVFAVHGDFDSAFNIILDVFETAEKAQRDVLREHLLDLFKVAPAEDQAVAKARIRLANLLF